VAIFFDPLELAVVLGAAFGAGAAGLPPGLASAGFASADLPPARSLRWMRCHSVQPPTTSRTLPLPSKTSSPVTTWSRKSRSWLTTSTVPW
jgi:hypothetical protein